MSLFLSVCITIAVIIAIFRSPFTPEWKAAAAQRKYDKGIKRAQALARAKLSRMKEADLAAFDLYAYAVELSDQCGIRPDTATLAMRLAGFSFGVDSFTQLERLQEYETRAGS